MKKNMLLVSFVALVAVFLVSIVAAAPLVSITSVEFNDIDITSGNVDIAGMAGEMVPVKVTFTANVDAKDVKVRAEIYGGRDEGLFAFLVSTLSL